MNKSSLQMSVQQGSQTVALQMFLDFNSQKSWPAEVVLKASGSSRLRTSEGPQFETPAVQSKSVLKIHNHWKVEQRPCNFPISLVSIWTAQ